MTKEESKKPKPQTRPSHRKVFDVVPPGKSVAPPNSRSVIVGHKPPVKDDQFVPGSPDIPAAGSAKSAARQTAEHSLMTGDPSEKRPLMDGRKKLELNPAAPGPAASSDATITGEQKAQAAPLDKGVKTAPELTQENPAPEQPANTTPKKTSDNAKNEYNPAEAHDVPELTAADMSKSDKSSEATAAPEIPTQSRQHAQHASQPNVYDDAPGHLADLAVEQTVEAGMFDREGASEQARTRAAHDDASDVSTETSGVVDVSADVAHRATSGRPQNVDDLLAETGPPDLTPQQAIVSTHHHRVGVLQFILILLLILLLVLVALNFLLDAEIITTSLDLPHTDLIR